MLAGDKIDLQTSSATVKGSLIANNTCAAAGHQRGSGYDDHLRRVGRGTGLQRGQHHAVAGVHRLTARRAPSRRVLPGLDRRRGDLLRCPARDRRPAGRLVPQRRHRPRARGRVRRGSAIAVPAVRHRDRVPGQHPGGLLAAAAGAVPPLRRADQRPLPGGRARPRRALAGRCSGSFGWTWELPPYLYLASVGLALAVIDLDTKRLPNALTLPSYVVMGLLLLCRPSSTATGRPTCVPGWRHWPSSASTSCWR